MREFKDYLKQIKKEYVDDQGKLVEKPDVETVADYKGPDPKSPPNKNASPYKPANDNVKSPTVKVEKGLADMGDDKLKYEPKTEYKQEVVKTKTEHFLNKTKNMSLAEFTKYMLDECGCGPVNDADLPYVSAYTTGKIQPHPPEAIKYVVVLANKNENILDNVVREIKNSGMLSKLIKSLMSDPETYDELTNLFGDPTEGPNRCKMFAKSMNSSLRNFIKDQESMYESVSNPIGFEDEDMEDEDMEDMEDMEDEDMEDMEDEDMEDMEDMEDEDEDEDEDMEDEDMEDEDMEDMEDEDMEDYFTDKDFDVRSKEKKLKKKFAHHNLLDAMKEFDFR